MSVQRSKGGGGKARPLLAGSLSVDGTASRDVPSVSESEGGGGGGRLRRHSTTSKDTREVEGSLRKVSKWFRDIKFKMDPIKVKDKIRYSRSSLATQASVAEEDEYAMQSVGKTATLRSRKPRMKLMEKRFNSLECLPGSEPAASTTAIRKMNSLQFETENGDPPDGPEERPRADVGSNAASSSSRVDAAATEATSASPTPSSAQSDRLTEEIERKLDEKEKLLEEILQLNLDTGWPSHGRCSSFSSTSSKVKVDLLESVYLANELTRLVNGCVRPDHLLPRRPTSQPRATDDGLEEDTCNYVRLPSKLADVINRLQDQLTSLMESVERNSDEVKVLKDEMETFVSASGRTPMQNAMVLVQEPGANADRCNRLLKKRSSSSSISDSECFLSLIRDLSEIN